MLQSRILQSRNIVVCLVLASLTGSAVSADEEKRVFQPTKNDI